MQSSGWLRSTYSQPIYGSSAMPSLNLPQPMRWWVMGNRGVCDPYNLLPPVFGDMTPGEMSAAIQGLPPELQEGGAAMTAYARLQFESIEPAHRAVIEQALLRYCELDTLALVMVVQAWQEWEGGSA